MKYGKRLLTLMTLFAGAGALWNLIDEYYILGSPFGVFIYWSMWMFLPILNLLCGTRTSNRRILAASLLLGSLYLCLFTFYMLNGNTSEKLGAEHLHIFLVPFMVLPLYSLLFFLYMLREHVKTHPRADAPAVSETTPSVEP
jgi:hypothetical protein